jgi:hypothetical protein
MNIDILHGVVLNLRPRHLLKVMRCNKMIYENIQKHPEYFWRVAVHMLFKHATFPGNKKIYYSMQNLPRGYHYAMTDFVHCVCKYLSVDTALDAVKKYGEWYEDEQVCAWAEDALNGVDIVKKIHTKIGEGLNLCDEKKMICDLSNYLEDEDRMTCKQKSAVSKSIMRTFRLSLEVLSNRVLQRVGDDVLQMFVLGVYYNRRQQSNKYSRTLDDLDAWTESMCTGDEFMQIPQDIRHCIVKQVREIIFNGVRVGFPEDYDSTLTYQVGMVQNKGERINNLHMNIKMCLSGNAALDC